MSRPRAKDEDERARELETFAPVRNFTIPLAARIRAAGGPPAYSVRKRRIEDIEAELIGVIEEALAVAKDVDAVRRARGTHAGIARRLGQLDDLVAAHNRYYPVEANLPLDPISGALLERGRRWEPLARPSLEALFARACRPNG